VNLYAATFIHNGPDGCQSQSIEHRGIAVAARPHGAILLSIHSVRTFAPLQYKEANVIHATHSFPIHKW
jgi:hypothetical protein